MPTNDDSKRYDLEDRTFEFAKASRAFVKKLPRTIANIEDAKQLIRSSGSNWRKLHRGERIDRKKGFCGEDQDLPARSQRKRLLATIARLRRGTRVSKSESFSRSARANENFRRHRPQIGRVNLNFEFGICFGFRISSFGF